MAVLITKYIQVGSYYTSRGYYTSSGVSFGAVSSSSGGSAGQNSLYPVYSSSTLVALNTSNNTTYLHLDIGDVSNNVTNGVWDKIVVAGTTFLRTNATYTQDVSTGIDRWRWSISSDPFSSNGTWDAVSFETAVTPPDTTITDVDTITRPNGSTNHSITIAAGSSNTIYEVRTVSASGTVVGTRTGNGAITVASIPSAGTSATYYITGRVTTANGGNNTAVLADTYIVLHEAASSGGGTGDGGTGTYGLRVYDASGNTTLDLSDRVVTFRERVQGSLSASETTKTVTLSGVGTAVINLTPITVIYVGNIPQRQKILYFTISGTSLTIQRTAVNAAGSSAATQSYDLLVVYDPVA
jgi:hypothetical protein